MPTYPTVPAATAADLAAHLADMANPHDTTAFSLPNIVGSRFAGAAIFGDVVRADHQLADVADLKAGGGAEGDGNIVQGAKLAQLLIDSGDLIIQSTTDADVSASWLLNNGGYYWDVDPRLGSVLFECHARPLSASVNRGLLESYVADKDGAQVVVSFRLDVDQAGAHTVDVTHQNGAGTTTVNLETPSAATIEEGYWFRWVVRGDDKRARLEYVQGALSSRPSDGDYAKGYEGQNAAFVEGEALRVGFAIRYLGGQPEWRIGALGIGRPATAAAL